MQYGEKFRGKEQMCRNLQEKVRILSNSSVPIGMRPILILINLIMENTRSQCVIILA
jgi:hypothetical protein